MYSRKKGFTLVELLVVIAIIGLLSTFGAVAYNRVKMDAKVTNQAISVLNCSLC